jgi:hypothetical protein
MNWKNGWEGSHIPSFEELLSKVSWPAATSDNEKNSGSLTNGVGSD